MTRVKYQPNPLALPAGNSTNPGVIGNRRRLRSVEAASRLPKLVPWTTATLINGWTHYAAPFGPFQYMKDAAGTVFLKGLVSPPAAFGVRSPLILPAGCRPGNQLIFAAFGATASGLERLDIGTDGSIICNNVPAGVTNYVSLSCSFKAEG